MQRSTEIEIDGNTPTEITVDKDGNIVHEVLDVAKEKRNEALQFWAALVQELL